MKKKKENKPLYTDRFGTVLEDGDFIVYITNTTQEICVAYVTDIPDYGCVFSRCYTEEWLVPGEALEGPVGTRGLWITRESHSLEELDANVWTIVALKLVDILTLDYGKVG